MAFHSIILGLPRQVIQPYRHLPPSLYYLFAAQVINRMGSFVRIILVFYLSRELGYSEALSGLLITLEGVLVMGGGFVSGHLTDWFRRKGMLTVTMTATALCFIPCGFLPAGPLVPALLILSGLFRGAVRPVQNAMVADITNPANRQAAFSLLYLGINLGVAVGPLIAGFLYKNFLSWVFWGDAATMLLALGLILRRVPDSTPGKEDLERMRGSSGDERTEEGRLLTVLRLRPVLLAFSAATMISTFVYAQHAFAVPLQLKALFGEDGARQFGVLMSFNAVFVLASTPFIMHTLRRFPPVVNMALANLAYAAGFGMLGFVSSMTGFFLSTILWTAGEVAAVTHHGVFVANHTPISHRGRFNGFMAVVLGSGHALSPWLAGMLVEGRSVRIMWPLSALLGLAAAAGYLGIFFWDRRHGRKTA